MASQAPNNAKESAAMPTRVECPTCATSYTFDRIGLSVDSRQPVTRVSIGCPLCGTPFDVEIEHLDATQPVWKFWAQPEKVRKVTTNVR